MPELSSLFGRDLTQRTISGLALAAAALLLTYLGPLPFAGLVLAIAMALTWEWGRVVRDGEIDAVMIVHGIAILAAIVATFLKAPAIAILIVAMGGVLAGVVAYGATSRLSAIGVLYVGLPAIALISFRSDPVWGFRAVLLLFVCVWGTDVAAYFSGRAIGGPKLWPRVSPNKTWAGFVGGVGTSAIAGAILSRFVEQGSALRLALTGLGLGIVAQLGDLAESALKRKHNVKDASDLIPGHGGFLDRVDGLVIAAVVAAAAAVLINVHSPARALLVGQ
ncbi:MAG TPA: phosphatidate cytidylyltransferase [Hyphomicrobiaceae bacterium]|nr:phosphatidate cytidylyltransferase [Hyphomicrobiaceae bacterium]